MVKNPRANGGDLGDMGLITGSGRPPGGGHGDPGQYSCLENPMNKGVCGVTESQTQLRRPNPAGLFSRGGP